ncbi:hypothetical protein ACP4OV_028173 [Aristida adscensionis]
MKVTMIVLLFLVALSSEAQRATCSNHNETDIDMLSLLDFKKHINLDPKGALTSWNGSTPLCRWTGVFCGNLKHPQRVTALDLTGQGLIGTISPSLGNLTFLQLLNLSRNSLTSKIPSSLGRLRQLQILQLMNNSIQGTIPNELSNCSSLIAILIARNQLEGEIPAQIASLPKLRKLVLSRNNLTGRIPSVLGNITTLTSLLLTFNHLEGGIPDELGQLSRIRLLQLGVNGLSGRIPQAIFNLSNLLTLSLEYNNLTMDQLPHSMGTILHNLQLLYLDGNRIGGTIPASLGNATHLEEIDLRENFLSGIVPPSLGVLRELSLLSLAKNKLDANDKQSWMFMDALANCSSLKKLSLWKNQLKGELPSSVGNLSSGFQVLLLGMNELSGSVPSSIGNLQGLTYLVLEFNNFDSDISEWVGNFKYMEKLFLSHNRFSGPVPPSLSTLSKLYWLKLASNGFEGFVPGTIGKLQHLQILDMSDNYLNGSMPVELFSLPALLSLNLSHNNLHGTLPLEIGNANKLVEIDISSNMIYGEIPRSLGNCESLQDIEMGNNIIHGGIPSSLTNLKGLMMLNLSHNNLSGPIPGFLGSQSFLQQLDLSYNNLQGEIPTNGIFTNVTALKLTGNNNLCGGVQELHFPLCPTRKRGLSHSLKVLITAACLLLVLALIAIVLLFYRKKLGQKSLLVPSVLDKKLPQVSYMDLAKATENFSPENVIGKGAHSSVYKGYIDTLKAAVAVKVFNLDTHGAQHSFVAECQALRSIRHRNLVTVLTACSSIDSKGDEFKAIVYEFMPSGNLDMLLHSQENSEHPAGLLNLTQRLNIANDVANALDYLHNGLQPPIVHCDLKPSNILLDDDMGAHVGDFGLARLYSDGTSISTEGSTSSIGLRGTIGYAAPEYATGCQISAAGDVYSFGVMLLEMITGKRPTDVMFIEDLSIVNFVQRNYPAQIMQVVDVSLQEATETIPEERMHQCLLSILETGLACTQQSPKERPEMQDVAQKLQKTSTAYLGHVSQ